MAVQKPDTSEQVSDRIKTDVKNSAPDSNPFLPVHWLASLIKGLAFRVFDFYRDLARAEGRLMPDTATGEYRDRWGAIYVGPYNPATPATGRATATGTLGSSIPVGTVLQAGGNEYLTTASVSITALGSTVASLTRNGTTATAVTAAPHLLSSFVPVTIAGAAEPEYNVTDAQVTVIDPTTFTYQVVGSPSTPATGAITTQATMASVPVESSGFGVAVNLGLNAPLTLQSPLTGVNSALYTDAGEIAGGTDAESGAAYQARYLDKMRNPVAHFNEADIIAAAKTVSGVTRVWVYGANATVSDSLAVSSITLTDSVLAKVTTGVAHGFDDGMVVSVAGAAQVEYNVTKQPLLVRSPTEFYYVVSGSPVSPATGTITANSLVALGQVVVYFMRDNDPAPFPSAQEIADVKTVLDAIRPATTSTDNLIVHAPTENPIDYVFTELVPNTATMRAAVRANLQQFHAEGNNVGVDDDEQAYKSAIISTIDPDTGGKVQSFTLASPVGDISNGAGVLSALGTVTFP